MKSNSYFTHSERAPYQFGHLLKRMPVDFSRGNFLASDDRLVAEAAIEHAANANDTLMSGLEALGHVMFVAGANKQCGVDGNHLANLGCLIAHIAVEAQFLQETESSIRETLEAHDEREAAAKNVVKRGGARAEVEV